MQEFFQHTKQIITVNGMEYHYFSLPAAEQAGLNNLSRLPSTLKILLENLLRHLDGKTVTLDDIKAVIAWLKHKTSDRESAYRPAPKPCVKTSFAPGSQVVTRYLEKTGLQKYLNNIGFTLVGYGCTTCIGNSGPLLEPVEKTITENDLIVSAVLSGNRNFEGRIHPLVKTNWLASPPFVIVFALTGTVLIDLTKDPIGNDKTGVPVYLKDLWPTNTEIAEEVAKITGKMFHETYSNTFTGSEAWRTMKTPASQTYAWREDSPYIQQPLFLTACRLHQKKRLILKAQEY